MRGIAEHVIVEPVAAHGLVPVARNLGVSAAIIGTAGHGIGGIGIDGVVSGQDDGPVIVVELSREKEGAGIAVIFGAMMSVVLVSTDRVTTEATILLHVDRKLVVMPEQDRLTVAPQHEFRRDGSVESPHR